MRTLLRKAVNWIGGAEYSQLKWSVHTARRGTSRLRTVRFKLRRMTGANESFLAVLPLNRTTEMRTDGGKYAELAGRVFRDVNNLFRHGLTPAVHLLYHYRASERLIALKIGDGAGV